MWSIRWLEQKSENRVFMHWCSFNFCSLILWNKKNLRAVVDQHLKVPFTIYSRCSMPHRHFCCDGINSVVAALTASRIIYDCRESKYYTLSIVRTTDAVILIHRYR
ncbi:uncharacterized protein PHALS_14595 [Plasmopara halstedii]|uniref:Uncharacterized protein n=1 Tax=Plasmopara halstedii TaxID=4781 RepID=A0A0P1AM53_PLAHL|nr:uncharacterized protein PHALS_14595 [Plasmopara halstedii]CEG42124.1 hypothetical protein PHALS_14595 [Plasmopara halstedii]|eukprot:XP_024578493.1 hypothetical protein PHALS_14595 [Plasmopara halstedii]